MIFLLLFCIPKLAIKSTHLFFPLFITHSNNNPDHNCSIQSLIFHVQLLCRKKRTSMKENILQKKLWFKELARLWVGGKSMLWLNNGLKFFLKMYRVSHSKEGKVILLWWGYRFRFCWYSESYMFMRMAL